MRAWEWRAAGGVRRTKDREVLALGVRTERVAVGHTTRDAVGCLTAPMETELKWPGELRGERTAISLF